MDLCIFAADTRGRYCTLSLRCIRADSSADYRCNSPNTCTSARPRSRCRGKWRTDRKGMVRTDLQVSAGYICLPLQMNMHNFSYVRARGYENLSIARFTSYVTSHAVRIERENKVTCNLSDYCFRRIRYMQRPVKKEFALRVYLRIWKHATKGSPVKS